MTFGKHRGAALAAAAILAMGFTSAVMVLAATGTGDEPVDAAIARGAALPAASQPTLQQQALTQPADGSMRLAQAQTLQVQPAVASRAGTTVKLPISVRGAAAGNRARIMLHQVPRWLTLSKGESVGAGVWLLSIGDAESLEGAIAAGAAGTHRVGVSIVGGDGRIAAETFITLTVSEQQAAVGVAPPAATAPAAAGPPPAAGAAVPNWQSLLDRQQRGATAGSPAQAATTTVAQAAPAVRPAASRDPAVEEARLVAQARHLVRECTTCHSLYGYDDGIPLMIGLTRERFLETMQLYKSGKRDHSAMKSVAETLDEEQTLSLALYLGRIRPPAPISPGAAARPAGPPEQFRPIAPAKRSKPEPPDRLARWITRGEQLIGAGDIAQARLVLERAAEHGQSRAAYLMGTSFDPNMLPWRPDLGLTAEPAKAREWYLYAQQLGAGNDAAERLADLPAR